MLCHCAHDANRRFFGMVEQVDKVENDKDPKISYMKFFISCDTEHSAKKLASMRSQWCARCHRCSIISLCWIFRCRNDLRGG